ncbi:multiple epidermal growth factor-like domains protein 10 [Saccostrea echinata]|uniref:multiple epidermal growth factor-like domains protein 10 n=1 Tax=Saccostrea echinata TaxID=191078 RepID=UPI002A8042A0|nr:multiple epidermal growth factor-like domains protein 10 [Saccostrea echinata]
MPYACLIITFLHTILGYENIALNKPTHQLHAYIYKKYGTAPFDSSNAVDGLKSDLSPYKGQCVISANGYKTATWWVNLTSVYSIHDIRIYYRTDNAPWGASNGYATRFLGFYVYVSNTTNRMDGHLCFHDTNYSRATIPAVLDIACPVHGQYVIYYNERPQNTSYSNQYSTDAHNELCEVEVNGCNKTGYYGTDCSLPCPWNCRYCHIETGACRGCKPGYKGRNCELRCDGGRYGQDCGLACGACLGGRQCHHISGSCLGGCDAGYKGRLCKTVCLPGTFGKNCKGNCSQNCGKPGKCFARTGVCVGGCQPGWEGPQCQKVCKEQKYGENCIHLCGFCRNSTCDLVDGSCMRGCAAGYQGPLCNKVCPGGYYGDNCNKECSLFCKTSRDCHHVTGHCTDGCTGGRRGEQCLQGC